MANSTVAAGLTVQQWDAKFFRDYVRQNIFSQEFGTNENSVIQLKTDLTKKKGDSITFALVNALSGAGVTGSSTLEGNEEAMTSRSHAITVDKLRNAVRVAEIDEQFSAISLRDAGKVVLKDWIAEKTRDQIILQLLSKNGTLYASANEAARDVWLVDNVDRVLFGALKSNNSGPGDHSAALANIDNTADKLDYDIVQLAKRLAKTATPKIRPIRIDDGGEYFILYCHPMAFRDLKADTESIHQNAGVRGSKNPLFRDGDLILDGVICREVPEIATQCDTPLASAGASSIQVAANFLCGAQAVGIGWAKRSTSVTEAFDYGDKVGVAIEEIRGIAKLTFGGGSADTDDLQDHGVFTIYTAGVADS